MALFDIFLQFSSVMWQRRRQVFDTYLAAVVKMEAAAHQRALADFKVCFYNTPQQIRQKSQNDWREASMSKQSRSAGEEDLVAYLSFRHILTCFFGAAHHAAALTSHTSTQLLILSDAVRASSDIDWGASLCESILGAVQGRRAWASAVFLYICLAAESVTVSQLSCCFASISALQEQRASQRCRQIALCLNTWLVAAESIAAQLVSCKFTHCCT